MSETTMASEVTVHTQPDVEALVQAAVSVLTNDMQIATHDAAGGIQVTNTGTENTVQLLVDTCSTNNIQERLYMCTDCNMAFYGEQGEQEWQWHLRQHKPHKCDLCSESFERKDTLKSHMRTHTMQMPYICEKCGSAYSLKSNLTQHMKTHDEKQYQCAECNVVFKNEADMTKHLKFHTGETINVYQCEVCNKTFAHQKNLVQHMKLHQDLPKQYKCPECPASYSYKCHLTRHLMIHTGDKPYKCKFCGKAFNRNAHLVRHRKIHSGGEKEWKCQQCGFAFWERSDLLRHIKSHQGNRPYQCQYCEQTFVWKRYLYKHLVSNHKADDHHFCHECCQTLPTDEALQEHLATGHPNKKSLTHTCEICQKEFHFKYKLDEHMFQHTGEKAHACDKCSSRFVSRKELDRHKADHTQEVSFSCNTCTKNFLSVEELQQHLRMHTGNGRFTCSICSQGFRWKSQLTNHMVVHSSDYNFNCSQCYKQFKRKRDLARHVRIFHDTKPPYTCTECSTDFFSPSKLHAHKTATHWKRTDELDNYFACVKCSGLFKLKSDLQRHIDKVHPPRPYLCTLCSRRFTMLKFLVKHFETKHEDIEMCEGENYDIRPQKETVITTNGVLNPRNDEDDEDELPNGQDEMEVEAGENDNGTEVTEHQTVVQEVDVDHIYTSISEMAHAQDCIVSSEEMHVGGENIVVIQQIEEDEDGILPDMTDSSVQTAQQQAPMSEAITLAQFSQQVSNNTIIPVFIQQPAQSLQSQPQATVLKTTQASGQPRQQPQIVIQDMSNMVPQSSGALSQGTKPHVVTVRKQPQIVKINRSTAQSLIPQIVSQTPPVVSTTPPVPIRIFKSGVTLPEPVKQTRQIRPLIKYANNKPIKIVPMPSVTSVVEPTYITMSAAEMDGTQPIPVDESKLVEEIVLSNIEQVHTETIHTDQAF